MLGGGGGGLVRGPWVESGRNCDVGCAGSGRKGVGDAGFFLCLCANMDILWGGVFSLGACRVYPRFVLLFICGLPPLGRVGDGNSVMLASFGEQGFSD